MNKDYNVEDMFEIQYDFLWANQIILEVELDEQH